MGSEMTTDTMIQTAPWPNALVAAVEELKYMEGWRIWIEEEDRGQGCSGLTLSIVPNNRDGYHPERPANTHFLYPVPAAAFNRESWEEWLWARIRETDDHERAEAFRFVGEDGKERRPFKPAHSDGWNPGVVRSVVAESVANTPNAGRLVEFPCRACSHNHKGKMGEHFVISEDRGCVDVSCACGKRVGARSAVRMEDKIEVGIDGLRFQVAAGYYTGLDIRHFMHPPLGKNYFLFVEKTEVPIDYSDEIEVVDGIRFITVKAE